MNVHPKVQNSTLSGAATILATYILSLFNVSLPPEVWVAATVVVGALAGWLTPSHAQGLLPPKKP